MLSVSKKALITGITGQDGSYLAELLLSKGYEVHGVVRRTSSLNRSRIDHLQHANPADGGRPRFTLHYGDMTDSGGLNRLVKQIRPDEVYNLSGQSSVGLSFEQPVETMDSISVATVSFVEAILYFNSRIRFYNASSSECFGDTGRESADEETAFRPSCCTGERTP